MAERSKIAVAPDTRPAMYQAMVAAVEEGGAQVVPVAEASGLMWADPGAAAAFPSFVAAAPQLEWVQLPYAGIENFADQLDPNITWTCGKGVYADPVAEHVIALTLAGFRHLHEAIPATSWPAQRGQNLLGATVTVIGAGGITESLLRLLEPWKIIVRVVRRTAAPMDGVERTIAQSDTAEVRRALNDSDVVVLAAPLTDQTRGMVNADFLGAMSPNAWLINVARGGLVDHDALVEALKCRSIAGAALDVTTPEPLPDDHPLWALPNCIITPHVGNTPEMGLPLIAARVRDNVGRWVIGEQLVGPVDVNAGY